MQSTAGSFSACCAPEPIPWSCFPHSLSTASTVVWVYSSCSTLSLLKLVQFLLSRLCYGESFFWPIYLLPVQCHSQILCRCNSTQVVLNRTSPSASPWGTPLMAIYLFVFEPLAYLEECSLASSPSSLCSICQVQLVGKDVMGQWSKMQK